MGGRAWFPGFPSPVDCACVSSAPRFGVIVPLTRFSGYVPPTYAYTESYYPPPPTHGWCTMTVARALATLASEDVPRRNAPPRYRRCLRTDQATTTLPPPDPFCGVGPTIPTSRSVLMQDLLTAFSSRSYQGHRCLCRQQWHRSPTERDSGYYASRVRLCHPTPLPR